MTTNSGNKRRLFKYSKHARYYKTNHLVIVGAKKKRLRAFAFEFPPYQIFPVVRETQKINGVLKKFSQTKKTTKTKLTENQNKTR